MNAKEFGMVKFGMVDRVLRDPYRWVLIPDPTTGRVSAKIVEFPGCVAEGATVVEAAENLARAAEAWVLAVVERGQVVPTPRGT